MLIELFEWLAQFHSGFNVFRYLTVRVIFSLLTALLICLFLFPLLIRFFDDRSVGEEPNSRGPESHQKKSGTPTMGGVLIVTSLTLSSIAWVPLGNYFVYMALMVTLAFGGIGLIDDMMKLNNSHSEGGMSAKHKFLLQSVCGVIAALFLFYTVAPPYGTVLVVPFFKDVLPELGWFFPILAYCVIVGTSNAVNLTDGLDGLAIMPVVLIAGALAVIAYVTGNYQFAGYLNIPYLAGAGELAVFCSAIVGSGLGFLWFNAYPAQVFMGDIGSLSLGSALGVIAILLRQELVLFIMGGLLVLETLSVILQVGSYKLTGKRVFRMAPLHHHFELKGWAEPKIIVRFWIVTLILVLIGLSSLKIR